MEEAFFDLADFLRKPSLTETFVDILLCAVPIWLAVMIGLLIGWSWRPRWTGLLYLGLRSKFRFLLTAAAPPGFGARRLWLAFTALSAFSACRAIWFNIRNKGKSAASTSPKNAESAERSGEPARLDTPNVGRESEVVTENDLEHLLQLYDGKAGEMEWQSMMERTTPNMAYQAWRHEPKSGPIIYRSRTVFEDASPAVVRDFFWDDEFRPKWDPMLAYFKTLEECPHTGTTIVHWIKKFPFFCSDREYIIGRRIWESGKKYYCVTKGVPYPAIQKRDKPRRVDLYFSSWVIKPVESRKGEGQISACEVTLVHYEDMGIPKDVAKLGVRHGMWGTVKKLHSGMRAYQNARKSESSLSRSALMARITTKMPFCESSDPLEQTNDEEEKDHETEIQRRQGDKGIDWKWMVVGGTMALVLGIHSGAVGKALLLGAGQRIARR
ncbi:uncharacterized protein LOC116208181 [Punica granatum]|uniref:START domain-containing protein n=2 Tax=Punica granatum TaxID=22663 RepID=A0A218W7J6_PUNGR|nr:uncharacterized protein LOC116208181 [Punica granatum]OWM68181.1 hypothetical protein CDL15_Pgr016381 [Punica granatum]PKI58563.1 hypothetical protein CRG98_021026 [Punica granatum]